MSRYLLCIIPVKEGRIKRRMEDAEGEEETSNHGQRVGPSAIAIRQDICGIAGHQRCPCREEQV
jgi:hypothetical protein